TIFKSDRIFLCFVQEISRPSRRRNGGKCMSLLPSNHKYHAVATSHLGTENFQECHSGACISMHLCTFHEFFVFNHCFNDLSARHSLYLLFRLWSKVLFLCTVP